MKTLQTAAHVAYVDPMTGVGLLVCPLPEHDAFYPCELSLSLHGADWDAMVQKLDAEGWEPLADDDGLPIEESVCRDGRSAVSLYGRDPITSKSSMEELCHALSELAKLAEVER